MKIDVKLLPGGQMPTKAHEDDAAFDCYAKTSGQVHEFGVAKIPLGFAIELSPCHEAQIRGRSGLAAQGILGHVGTVDSGYRGEVSAILFVFKPGGFSWKAGDRVCQMAIRRVVDSDLVEVAELSISERGNGGFGSTGR